MAKKTTNSPINVTRGVKIEFTEKEISTKAKRMCELIREKEEVKNEAKSTAEGYKEAIALKDNEIEILAKEIDNGSSVQPRECKLVKNFNDGVREYWFDGNIVETEPLEAIDHQLELEEAETKNKDTDEN